MRQPPQLPPLQLEHDYIGQSETMSTLPNELLSSAEDDDDDEHLKETELRLGLPGSESHTKKKKDGDGPGLTLGILSSHGLGAKRVFSDAIDGSGNWVFLGVCGNEVESKKGAASFSPRGGNGSRKGAVVGGSGAMDPGVGGKAAAEEGKCVGTPAAKAQVVGWPPIRNYRRNTMGANPSKNNDSAEDNQCSSCLYVKVSMDGAPYLRKIDLKMYRNYKELSTALERMFSCFITGNCGSHRQTSKDGESHMSEAHVAEYVLTYKDKDGDWMLVGDVPWSMFTDNCKRLRIMKSSEAIGLGRSAPQEADKLKNKE